MASIIPSNTTTQLLIKNIGVDTYTSLKLPGNFVVLPDFFEDKSVADTMPKIFIDDCPTMVPDNASVCTWVISNDETNNIIITDSTMVMQVRNSSGSTVLPASELVAYESEGDTTYALNIYIKSSGTIEAGEYSAVIKL